jgi:hypothetical protein
MPSSAVGDNRTCAPGQINRFEVNVVWTSISFRSQSCFGVNLALKGRGFIRAANIASISGFGR